MHGRLARLLCRRVPTVNALTSVLNAAFEYAGAAVYLGAAAFLIWIVAAHKRF